MSTIHFIIGHRNDATRLATEGFMDSPNLAIDPIEMVSLAKLFVILTGFDYDIILEGFSCETPDQPDIEPWDFENLIFPIYSISDRFVSALVNMRDDQLPAIAEEWTGIEEFSRYKFTTADLTDELLAFREFAAESSQRNQSLLIYFAP